MAMRFSLTWGLCAIVTACFAELTVHGGEIQVEIVSASKEYVIGEPVPLDVTVKNVSDRVFHTWIDPLSYQIEIHIARAGDPFHQYTCGDMRTKLIRRMVEALAPGQSKCYPFRVLGTFYVRETAERRSRLAFETPGLYRAKARYPLYPNGKMFESNTVEFRVNERQGVDAKVWEEINQQRFLRFLQSGEAGREDRDVLEKAVEVLRTAPKSSFQDPIKWALEKYYRKRTSALGERSVLLDADLEKIRDALRIPAVPQGPFPDDKRLDAWISYGFPEQTPFEEVFKTISNLSGVPLRVGRELRVRTLASIPQTTKVWTFMEQMAGRDVHWVRERDGGYRLVPVRHAEEEKQGAPK